MSDADYQWFQWKNAFKAKVQAILFEIIAYDVIMSSILASILEGYKMTNQTKGHNVIFTLFLWGLH